MAQHGGTAYLADAHPSSTPAAETLVGPTIAGPRPVAALAALSPASRARRVPPPPPEGVSLEAPRLDGDRVNNEYVETPFRPPNHPPPAAALRRVPSSAPDAPRRGPGLARRTVAPEAPRPAPGKTAPITKQPTASPPLLPTAAAATFTKEGPRGIPRHGAAASAAECAVLSRDGAALPGASIMCNECNRCRCEACRSPRPLPSAWLCRDACFCSAETTVDYASCLCCVKGMFYHCGGKEGYEGGSGATSCADDPCSCAPPRRCLRWACLCALTACLPCLLCYWPLRGVAGAVERCYGRYASTGCRCQPRTTSAGGAGGPLGSRGAGGDLTPEKRLLASSPDF
ncbi:protein sprouty [Ischnura elegans]|uniref:protein sprouty n=1 Tax=Ischnura elegans TaxID=197161 RepID=UPI001ED89C9E|nr:protein sprouty [Ischnura elegans]XP_046395846.1 protein sprouty [Ischnura elegans]